MHFARSLVCAALLGAVVSAQDAAVVVSVDAMLAALAARGDLADGEVEPVERFMRLATAQFQAQVRDQGRDKERPVKRERRLVLQRARGGQPKLLVSGPQEQVDAIVGVVNRLSATQVPTLRVQCTLVRLPRQIAAAHELEVGRAVPIDEAKAGALIKQAIAAKGSLQNLPETLVRPLVPFRAEPPAGDGATAAPQLRVRGEAVLATDREAWFDVQLVEGKLPEDPTLLPPSRRLHQALRLEVGTGAMLLAPPRKDDAKDADVVALWLRFVDLAGPKPPDPGK